MACKSILVLGNINAVIFNIHVLSFDYLCNTYMTFLEYIVCVNINAVIINPLNIYITRTCPFMCISCL